MPICCSDHFSIGHRELFKTGSSVILLWSHFFFFSRHFPIILYSPCPSPRISHFSKVPWFPPVQVSETKVWMLGVFVLLGCHSFLALSLDRTVKYIYAYPCIPTYLQLFLQLSIFSRVLKQIRIHAISPFHHHRIQSSLPLVLICIFSLSVRNLSSSVIDLLVFSTLVDTYSNLELLNQFTNWNTVFVYSSFCLQLYAKQCFAVFQFLW